MNISRLRSRLLIAKGLQKSLLSRPRIQTSQQRTLVFSQHQQKMTRENERVLTPQKRFVHDVSNNRSALDKSKSYWRPSDRDSGIRYNIERRELYWPNNDLEKEYYTPMANAIKEKCLMQVESLIDRGWNAYIEQDFILSYENIKGVSVYGFTRFTRFLAMKDYIQDQLKSPNKHPQLELDYTKFLRSVLELMCKAASTGVTLSDEFQSAFEYDIFSEKYAYLILETGLNSKMFQEQTGQTLNEYLSRQYIKRENEKVKGTTELQDKIKCLMSHAQKLENNCSEKQFDTIKLN